MISMLILMKVMVKKTPVVKQLNQIQILTNTGIKWMNENMYEKNNNMKLLYRVKIEKNQLT